MKTAEGEAADERKSGDLRASRIVKLTSERGVILVTGASLLIL